MYRQRILDHLALLSSKKQILEYQESVPTVDVSAEIFNQWDECFRPGLPEFDSAFSDFEFKAVVEFSHLLDLISERIPQILPPVEVFLETDEWEILRAGAQQALMSFMEPPNGTKPVPGGAWEGVQ